MTPAHHRSIYGFHRQPHPSKPMIKPAATPSASPSSTTSCCYLLGHLGACRSSFLFSRLEMRGCNTLQWCHSSPSARSPEQADVRGDRCRLGPYRTQIEPLLPTAHRAGVRLHKQHLAQLQAEEKWLLSNSKVHNKVGQAKSIGLLHS